MKTKVMKCLAFAVMIMALGLCFVGCDLFNNNLNKGQNDDKDNKSTTTYTVDSNFKTTYYVGDDFDYNNAYIYYTENGQQKSYKFGLRSVTQFDTSEVGTFTMFITIEYGDVYEVISKSYTVIDYDVVEIVDLNGMTYEFYQNDSIFFIGVKAVLKLSNNTQKEIKVNSSMFKNLSTSTVGNNKTFTFTYNGISKDFNYSVLENVYVITGVSGIDTEYCVGDSIVLNNATVTYTKNGKDTGTYSVYEGNISNFSTATIGRRDLVITTLGTTYSLQYQVYNLNNLVEGKLYYYQCNDSNGKYIYVYVNSLYSDSAELYIGFSSATPSTVKANPTAVSKSNLHGYSVMKKNSFTTNSKIYDTSYSSSGSVQVSGGKFVVGNMDASGSACTISYYASVNSSATATYRLTEY